MKHTLFATLLFAILGMTTAQSGCVNQYVTEQNQFFCIVGKTDIFSEPTQITVLATIVIAPALVSDTFKFTGTLDDTVSSDTNITFSKYRSLLCS